MGSDQKKMRFERSVFESFAETIGLAVDLGSIRQLGPPAPDIQCVVAGEERAFELIRLTEPDIEEQFGRGQFSGTNYKIEAKDVVANIVGKQRKKYSALQVELLIHEGATPLDDLWLFDQVQVDIEVQAAVDSASFDKVWIFDETSKRVRMYSKAISTCFL